jgi:hypothetical protein
VLRRDAGSFETLNPGKEDLFVAQVIPRRIEGPLLELIVPILDAGQRLSCLVVEEPDIDALIDTDAKSSLTNLADTGAPLLPRLAEEIIIQKM